MKVIIVGGGHISARQHWALGFLNEQDFINKRLGECFNESLLLAFAPENELPLIAIAERPVETAPKWSDHEPWKGSGKRKKRINKK